MEVREAMRKHGVAALVLALAMAALYFATDIVHSLDRRIYDAAVARPDRQALSEVVIVAIDEASLAQMGAWPWPRDVHAQVIDRLAAAGAKTIVHTTPLDHAQTYPGQAYLRDIRATLGAAAPEAATLSGLIGRTLDEADAALNTDQRLASSIQRAGNVLLGSRVQPDAPGSGSTGKWPPYVHRSALPDPGNRALGGDGVRPPIALLGEAAAGVGHMQVLADSDGVVRRVPLVLRQDGAGMPALALLAAAHSLRLGMRDVQWLNDRAMSLGGLTVLTDEQAVLRPPHYAAPQGAGAFVTIPFHEVLAGKVPPARLQNKVVLIGGTAPEVQSWVSAPGARAVAPVQLLADQISGIRQGHVVTQPVWAMPAMAVLWLAVVLFLAGVLPRLGGAAGAGIALGLALGLAGVQWLGLALMGQWFPAGLAVVTLMAGALWHVARSGQAGSLAMSQQGGQGATEADRMMGLALQGQGQLDMAFERLRRVPAGLQVQDNLMHLAQDFERKHQYDKAQAVYEHVLRQDREHKEARARRKRVKRLAEVAAQAGAIPEPQAPSAQSAPELLGRYHIEKELGRGSMGVVYQGRDPKIGRVVAIKALALGQEFDGAALVDARARFFREAESAGRLQHQNIVTIYDAGDEHGLAWIAMELLKGQDLTGFTRADHLLPLAQVVSIVAAVADALDYAHQQNVVHRDIKPANIMFDAATGAVKVSDFGIARITDSSKTRTGLVLGTPSFMAPEQLAGHKVDGRCDLYALGVTLFQLLTASLPLRGASMSELMHNIARTPAPDVRTLRPDVPPELARIVALALRKNPQERYQTGRQLATDLRNVENGMRAGSADAPANHSLVYDARSDLNEHKMADFQETVMDDPVQRASDSAMGPGAR